MRVRARWVVAAWLALAVACSSVIVDPGPVPEPAPVEPLPRIEIASRARLAARAWLRAGQAPTDDVFGVAALLQPPAAADDRRNMAFCTAFHQALPAADRITLGEPVITYWPVTDLGVPEEPAGWSRHVSRSVCDRLLATYPYDVAQSYAQRAGLAGVEGPVLIALRRARTGVPEVVFAFNLSNAPDHEIRRAVMVWRQQITGRAVRGPRLAFIREQTRWILNGIELPFLVMRQWDGSP